MHLESLSLTDFRNIAGATFGLEPTGTTVVTGSNGSGKTSLLEAIGYLATQQSFRGVPKETMVKADSEQAIVRARVRTGDRPVDIEAEITRSGRSRTMVNRQRVDRRTDLHDALQVTVFSPDDIEVVRGGPAGRRRFLDDLLIATDPRTAPVIDALERTVRQRTALLRRAGGRLSPDLMATLEVWDVRLHQAGTQVAEARSSLTEHLISRVTAHHTRLAGATVPVGLRYQRSWVGSLDAALLASQAGDVARGVTSIGPHRDELVLLLDGLPARTHASQGEQRTLALALRLASHELVTAWLGMPPVLLLDDVFSELDPYRSEALLAGLGDGQAILTTAIAPPSQVEATRLLTMDHGVVHEHIPPTMQSADR